MIQQCYYYDRQLYVEYTHVYSDQLVSYIDNLYSIIHQNTVVENKYKWKNNNKY